jgi:hypothetical protein
MTGTKLKRVVLIIGINILMIGGGLLVLDLILMATGVFPPRYELGDADVGWTATPSTGAMITDSCVDFSTGTTYEYARNDDGVRTSFTSEELRADTTHYEIAVTGDSHTDLCAPNELTHPGVLAAALRERGVPAREVPFGAGRYSPLQGYLIFKKTLEPYGPDAFVLNVYTGNDFNDMMRVDDRPYMVQDSGGYRIHAPEWYRLADPNRVYRSRVRYAFRSLLDAFGIANLYFRFRFLSAAAAQQGKGLFTVLAYVNDLRRSVEPSVGYPEAFTAQFLNQQLFFHHFTGSFDESLRRLRALLEEVRREYPDVLLILSAIPSYQLTTPRAEADSALLAVTDRIPVDFDAGVAQESRLYHSLAEMAVASGWLFVDNLAALRDYKGSERLYNTFDYHLTPVASEIVGHAQADVLWTELTGDAAGSQSSRERQPAN